MGPSCCRTPSGMARGAATRRRPGTSPEDSGRAGPVRPSYGHPAQERLRDHAVPGDRRGRTAMGADARSGRPWWPRFHATYPPGPTGYSLVPGLRELITWNLAAAPSWEGGRVTRTVVWRAVSASSAWPWSPSPSCRSRARSWPLTPSSTSPPIRWRSSGGRCTCGIASGFFGQVQNQAYGYLWPIGRCSPPWTSDRSCPGPRSASGGLIVLVTAFLGVVRLSGYCPASGDAPRVIAGAGLRVERPDGQRADDGVGGGVADGHRCVGARPARPRLAPEGRLVRPRHDPPWRSR